MFCASSPSSLLMMEMIVIPEMLVSFSHLLRLMAQNDFFLNLVAVKVIGVILLEFTATFLV
jgi:hypothetical protein